MADYECIMKIMAYDKLIPDNILMYDNLSSTNFVFIL